MSEGPSKKDEKPRSRADANGVHESEDLHEESNLEHEDEQVNHMHLQDRPDPDDEETGQDGDEEQDQDEDEMENDEDFMETLLAAWSTKEEDQAASLATRLRPAERSRS